MTYKAFLMVIISLFSLEVNAQTIIGKWQMVKETTCLEGEMQMDDNAENLLSDMKSRSTATPQIIQFKQKNEGEESTRVLSRKKTYNNKSFLYRFDGSSLYILDKKSRTIVEGFTVEKFKGDSLIISNASRPCETKVLVRIK